MANISNQNDDLYATVHKYADISDLDEIFAIEQSAKTIPWTQQMLQDSLQSPCHFWTIKISNKIIGFIIFSIAADECEILNLCINPENQNQGYASTLLQHVIAFAKQHYINNIFLEVRQSNHNAINLYQKAEFKKAGLRKDYYKTKYGREDAIVLRLNIT